MISNFLKIDARIYEILYIVMDHLLLILLGGYNYITRLGYFFSKEIIIIFVPRHQSFFLPRMWIWFVEAPTTISNQQHDNMDNKN